MIGDQDLKRRTMAAWFRSGEVLQPAGGPAVLEHAGKRYAVLRNASGRVLAVYRVRNDGMLKRLKRWPAELNTH